jgi:hypothetical protein
LQKLWQPQRQWHLRQRQQAAAGIKSVNACNDNGQQGDDEQPQVG